MKEKPMTVKKCLEPNKWWKLLSMNDIITYHNLTGNKVCACDNEGQYMFQLYNVSFQPQLSRKMSATVLFNKNLTIRISIIFHKYNNFVWTRKLLIALSLAKNEQFRRNFKRISLSRRVCTWIGTVNIEGIRLITEL